MTLKLAIGDQFAVTFLDGANEQLYNVRECSPDLEVKYEETSVAGDGDDETYTMLCKAGTFSVVMIEADDNTTPSLVEGTSGILTVTARTGRSVSCMAFISRIGARYRMHNVAEVSCTLVKNGPVTRLPAPSPTDAGDI